MFRTINRWKSKGKLKLILLPLFFCSVLFISYQFIYYFKLTNYQSEETGGKLKYLIKDRKNSESYLVYKQNQDSISESGGPKSSFNSKVPSDFDPSIVVGAPPEYKVFYSRNYKNKRFFSCFSTGKKISWEKVRLAWLLKVWFWSGYLLLHSH